MGDDSMAWEDPKQQRKIEVLGFEEPLGLAMYGREGVWETRNSNIGGWWTWL